MNRETRSLNQTRPGDNQPRFQQVQFEFAAHIRHPELHNRPADIDPVRMQIYVDLFYRNIESFIANTFRVARKLFEDDAWRRLVRKFVHQHVSESPYFLEIPQEFLAYLSSRQGDNELPDFLLELCHYEWVELALDVADAEVATADVNPDGDLLSEILVWSPVAMLLSYRYPVHQIGPNFQPKQAPSQPTRLIVYRDRTDRVRFMEVNQGTARVANLIQEAAGRTGEDILKIVALESGIPVPEIRSTGLATLQQLRRGDIIAGTRSA